ncbi:MAG: transketolase [Actinomycetia bacterium]|nr:transketolase [Actinomycetes bacterium]
MPESMRIRFVNVATNLLVHDESIAIVLAAIGRRSFDDQVLPEGARRRIVDVGIREQTQIGVAAGLSLEGLRPIVMGYAPFLIERPFEQIKLSVTHQGASATLVSVGASWDASAEGRTHQAPEDVALMSTLPGWTVQVPGHADELETFLRESVVNNARTYIRTSGESNEHLFDTGAGRIVTLRRGSASAPTILALGPAADDVLAAAIGLDMTVLYASTVEPFDAHGLRAAVLGDSIAVVEHHVTGTTMSRVVDALRDRPMRFHAIGIDNPELARYGTPAEHKKAHRLDPQGIRHQISDIR